MNIWTHLAAYSLIETQRLYLRPFLFEDAEDFYKIASNPDNLQFIFPAQADLAETQYVLARSACAGKIKCKFSTWVTILSSFS